MALTVVIEFYRTRQIDDAHAVVGREAAVAADLDEAIAIAWRLAQTLDMPQRPDALAITDGRGGMLYSTRLEAGENPGKPNETILP